MAIQSHKFRKDWIASSQGLLAMTADMTSYLEILAPPFAIYLEIRTRARIAAPQTDPDAV